MSRQDKYAVGDYWLDKRRDGASPDIWQITTYKPGSRQIVYRSTKCSSLEDAKGAIHAYVEEERARKPTTPDALKLVPSLFTYWKEHGKKAERPDAIACSLRIFIGFLMQDEAAVEVTIANCDRALFERFIDWRMAPHSYDLIWAGKAIKGVSNGVKGETVNSDLARVAAAINHQVKWGRIPMAPKVPSVDKRLRSEAREYRYSLKQMGAIMAVASHDIVVFRDLALQLATLVRPEAAHLFDPRTQYDADTGVIDLQPKGKARTKKRNPSVPAIEEFKPFLETWAIAGAQPVRSRKAAWRTIRRLLDLPVEAEAKTLRYSVATLLRNKHRVPAEQVEMQLGHRAMKSVTERYAKYDPDFLAESKAALSKVWGAVMEEAEKWLAVHSLSKTGNGKSIVIDTKAQKSLDFRRWNGGAAYRTRTCDPRITNAGKGPKTAVSREVRTKRSGNR